MDNIALRLSPVGLLRRPETGALLGLAAVFSFFSIFGGDNFLSVAGVAGWLNVASSIGIVAIPIGLLIIAGELDISIGSMIPAGSMTVAIISGYFQEPIFLGVVAALALGALVGFLNGLLVVRTALPSLIVTLGTLFSVAGLVLFLSVIITGTTSVAIDAGPTAKFLLGHFVGGILQVAIFWWMGIALFFGFILHFSRYGNWILAMGGDRVSARNAGIPTERLTILLFMSSGVSAAFVGVGQAILFNSAQVSAGQSYIFNAIVAVVVGGVLLTGGYSGTVEMDGKIIDFNNPREAGHCGIATVHQFGGTFPLMTIGRSFFVGQEPTRGWGPFKAYDRRRANAIAVSAVRELGITRINDGDRLVGGLSGGERQALAIARAVYFGAKVLILDEPTAALGVKEAAHVLRIVLKARQKGIAVIFITHQVVHALTVGDHFAVLIRGIKASDFRKGEKSREEITDLMAGGEHMAELEAEISSYMKTHGGHSPHVGANSADITVEM